jgi:methylthioribose-1-phosphate isomerase
MRINGKNFHTIWLSDDETKINIIDQRCLPFELKIIELTTVNDVFVAIKEMYVRGAPLIGVTAAFGIYLAALNSQPSSIISSIKTAAGLIKSSRPTAVNLFYTVNRMLTVVDETMDDHLLLKTLKNEAHLILNEEIKRSRLIGEHGAEFIKAIYKEKKDTVNVLTHCNAGWLACIDYGTALAPIYKARDLGIPLHVWVDETRPRNQGARLTAFELLHEQINHTIIADNTGGHLMQHGKVDLVIVGCDRLSARGDAANKIGTYLKALAAYDNHIPFYVALPTSTIDLTINDGIAEIPIEERSDDEMRLMEGLLNGKMESVELFHRECKTVNFGFDVTPARLISGLITEKGVINANEKAIKNIFND